MGLRQGALRLGARRHALASVLVALLAQLAWAGAASARPEATITASPFTDGCRDISFRSTKDISHVEVHHADGRVAKDESIDSPDHTIDGGVGDEIDRIDVKSGTTVATFACPRTNSPPTAVLEIATPPFNPTGQFSNEGYCLISSSLGFVCDMTALDRSAWTTASQVPPHPGYLVWACHDNMPDPDLCPPTIVFRSSASRDPDNDIVSWSIDFGDGSVHEVTGPLGVVSHDYGEAVPDVTVTMTVTDSAGQSAKDSFKMYQLFTLND